jgi:hypothetical protein
LNKQIASRLDRANLYLDRIRTNIQKRQFADAIANAAELGFQAGALYDEIRKCYVANFNSPLADFSIDQNKEPDS